MRQTIQALEIQPAAMLRFLAKSIALLALAASFATLVVDGTRSIAGGELALTPFSDLIKARLPALESMIGRNIHPLLWDPVLLGALKLPAWAVFLLIGGAVLWLGSRRGRDVGRSSQA